MESESKETAMGTAENRGCQRPQTLQSRTARVLRVVCLVLLAGVLLGGVPLAMVADGWAQAAAAGATEELRQGKVTALGEQSIQINGKDYPVDPNITVKHASGDAMTLGQVGRGDLVKFHLKKGRLVILIVVQQD